MNTSLSVSLAAVCCAGLAAQTPNLVVAAIDRSALTSDPQTLVFSGNLVVTLRNRGDAAAAPCQATVFEDSDLDRVFTPGHDHVHAVLQVPAIAAGAQARITTAIAGRERFRDDLITVWVDSGQVVSESDENDNLGDTGRNCRLDPILEWMWNAPLQVPTSINLPSSPMICDLDGDGNPEVIFHSTSSIGSGNQVFGELRAVDGRTGARVWDVVAFNCVASFTPGIGDIDGDGRPEVITAEGGAFQTSPNHLLCFEHDGTFKWRSDPINNVGYGAATLADLDHDGTPEIVIGKQVVDAQGHLLWTGSAGYSYFLALVSIVADIDLDGSPEIVAGNTIYSASGSVEFSAGGSSDGYNAIGNFDGDPAAEWIEMVSGGRPSYLRKPNGTIVWQEPPSVPSDGRGGPPTVADFDGDGRPEIGIAGATLYRVFDGDGSVLWSRAIRDGTSGQTGSTAFDFDGDGAYDVIYRDETTLWVFRGIDGAPMWSTPMSSCTWLESATVADVDADGHAEILIGANNTCNFGPQRGLFVFGDRRNQWASARKVWNQYCYAVTNVNEDGTIPAVELPNWLVPAGQPLNNFRVNPAIGGSPMLRPDLSASALALPCVGTQNILVRVGNGGAVAAPAGVRVDFYFGDPHNGGSLIGTVNTASALQPGEHLDIGIPFAGPISGGVTALVDPLDVVLECNERNNEHAAPPCNPASVTLYGVGWPGSSGVPAIALDAVPQLGTNRLLRIGNSFGQATSAILAIGAAPGNQFTGLGGTLLVNPFMLPTIPLAVGTTDVPFGVPCMAEFCGASLYFQAIEIDLGASDLLSFSQGLQVTFGR